MNYTEFKNKWLGKLIDFDGRFGGQCFDVVNQYIFEMTGKRPHMRLLAAADIYHRPPDIVPNGVQYQRIANTPDFVPSQGDIVVWDRAAWNRNYGHVGIIDSSDLNRGVVLQQDGFNPTEGVRLVNWNWHTHNFIGVLRLQTQDVVVPPAASNIRTEGNMKQFRVARGGWRSQVIEELIQAGLYQGSWQSNQPQFDALNPTTPQGGWTPGMWVNYEQVVETPPPSIQQVVNDMKDAGVAEAKNTGVSGINVPEQIEGVHSPNSVARESVSGKQVSTPDDLFSWKKFWLGRLKSYLRSNVDKALLTTLLVPILTQLNSYYNLGFSESLIVQFVAAIATWMIGVGVATEKMKK